ncbi:S41 family peptidase [Tundrisphaera lichenicola]|uniref:S41 family peptidase n=1 Tax=Tundrisphaera lichenicola TaxID=2029860 RepID=UPI003EB715A8
MIRRSLAILGVLACVGPAHSSASSEPTPDFAARIWAVTDVILARHVDPPARQQMILAGLKNLIQSIKAPTPPGLARRVSEATEPEALAALLTEVGKNSAPDNPAGGPEEAFLKGLSSAVPGGVELLSAKERKVQEQFEGNLYVGIQVALGVDEASKRPTFAQVFEGGPAALAGAKIGDQIEAIEGASTEGLSLTEVVDRLRGEEGSAVAVRLKRPGSGEVLDVSMTRATLPRKTVQGLTPRDDGGWNVRFEGPAPIGYLKITEIVGSTPREFRTFASQMESEGLRALVLDLREVTTQAGFHPTVLLADALLDGGTIGRIAEADSSREIRAEPDALFRDWPMVVLAGGARSAEVAWLCAGLRENRGATILGRADLNRIDATVRSIVPVPGGDWSIRIATGRLEWGDDNPLAESIPREGRLIELARALSPTTAGPASPSPGVFRGPRSVRDDPLPEARALLEAALKSPGSQTPGISEGEAR